MNVINFIKKSIKNECEKLSNSYDTSISELHFGNVVGIYWREKENILEFELDGYVIYSDNLNEKENISSSFTCSYKTKKGYISSKKLPVIIKDIRNVTINEASELLNFNTDAIKNTFDPFWHENEAKRRNAAAWNHIAQNYITDSNCTK